MSEPSHPNGVVPAASEPPTVGANDAPGASAAPGPAAAAIRDGPPPPSRPVERGVAGRRLGRRTLLWGSAYAATAGAAVVGSRLARPRAPKGGVTEAETFIARVAGYDADLVAVLVAGLTELGVTATDIRDKRILLKPNLVEVLAGGHVNTHPLLVRGAIEAFLHLGAATVLVAEGSGHSRDSLLVVEESGLADVLVEDRIRFVDLNYDPGVTVPNTGGRTKLPSLTFPATLMEVDWIVSLPKMKTHHWGGVTLSLKNMFGVMPGFYYGWPKNVLHWHGIDRSIFDINAALQATGKPHLAIVDGIVGLEGDGPIMGTPKHAGIVVMGRNFAAVDATSARVMGVDPRKVPYLAATEGWLGPLAESHITQRGETIAAVRTDFQLLDKIPAQRGIRL